MHSFSIAAIMMYHKLGGLSQQTLIIKYKINQQATSSSCWKPLSFHGSCLSSSIFQSPSSFTLASFIASLFSWLGAQVHLYWHLWFLWIQLDNSGWSPHLKILNFFVSTKSPSLCKVTYRLWRRRWTSLERLLLSSLLIDKGRHFVDTPPLPSAGRV